MVNEVTFYSPLTLLPGGILVIFIDSSRSHVKQAVCGTTKNILAEAGQS
jgi:hypothetical protein